MEDRKAFIQTWILPAFIVSMGVVGCYWPVLKSMAVQWIHNDDFSHGILILPLAGYIVWQRRKKLATLMPQTDWRGLGVMALAIGLYILGELGAELFTTRAAIIILCIGAVWWLYGLRVLHELVFPLLLLFLMLPLPGFIYRNLTFGLQILSSTLSVNLLNALGYIAYREGNIIDMGFGQFQVVEACNGLRFIMPMLTLGVLFAFMQPQVWWKRAVLVAITIPLAMVTNVLRIVATGILAMYLGTGVAQGFFHDFSGWAVFMASFALFGLFALLLRHLPGTPMKTRLAGKFNSSPAVLSFWKRMTATLAALLICLISPLVVNSVGQVDPVSLKKPLAQFPLHVGGREGVCGKIDRAVWQKVGGQDYVIIDYAKPNAPLINFYTAFYEYQRKGGDFIHSPKLCLPGGGWFIITNQVRNLSLQQMDATLPSLRFNELLVEKNGQRQLVYYWYQGRGRNFTNEYMAKFYMVWDGIWRRRTDGALVRLTMPLPSMDTVQPARRMLDPFALVVARELHQFLP